MWGGRIEVSEAEGRVWEWCGMMLMWRACGDGSEEVWSLREG